MYNVEDANQENKSKVQGTSLMYSLVKDYSACYKQLLLLLMALATDGVLNLQLRTRGGKSSSKMITKQRSKETNKLLTALILKFIMS